MVSGTRAVPKLVVVAVGGGSRAAAPKGSMTYAFTHMGSFLLLLLLRPYPPSPSLQAHISAWRPISQPQGPNPSHEAQIPREWNLGLGVWLWSLRVGFGPQDWDLGLEAGIWASRLRYGPGGWGREGVRRRRRRRRRRRKLPIWVKA